MTERGYSLPNKFLSSIALVIARQRSSAFQIPATFRVRGLNWARQTTIFMTSDVMVYSDRLRARGSATVPKNVYSLDVTGVLLSVLSSLKF